MTSLRDEWRNWIGLDQRGMNWTSKTWTCKTWATKGSELVKQ